MQVGRYIGVHHGVKKLVNGKVSPTQLTIIKGDDVWNYELGSENEELDLVSGLYPTSYREVKEGEDISSIPEHQIKKRKQGKKIKIPAAYEGIHQGDTVAMILGGSGDAFAEALARRSEEVGATFYRIAPFRLKEYREDRYQPDDSASYILADLARWSPDLFQAISSRDIDLIRVREIYRRREDTMKDRMAAASRLRQQAIGQAFREAGLAPENTVEMAFERLKTTNPSYLAIEQEEKQVKKELEQAIKELDIYPLFEAIEGVGPAIAARLIASIIDVKRFPTASKMKRYCGVAVIDGKFMRQRSGETCGYSNTARQALYLIGDQFNRRPDSEWGQKLREYKVKFREKHPEETNPETGKKRYTKAHIHRMATWRTVTKFVEWLYREWMKIEMEAEEPLSIV